MRILITGGNGQLGNALKEVLKKEEALFTDSDDMDITKPDQIEKVFNDFKPEYLVHGAAYTSVDGCEENPEFAEKVNAQGSKNLAEACKKHDVKMIYISTDYVFDGTKKEPYLPEDQTGPQSVYGKTKLAGEVATRDIANGYVLRTSWVYGEGNNFVRTMLNLSEKMDELSIVNDQLGRSTYALDLAKAIYDVIIKSLAVGIYHVTGDGPIISWADFAEEIFKIADRGTKVKKVTTEEYLSDKKDKKTAPRPAYSVLDLKKSKEVGLYIANWKVSLKQYLESQ